MTTMLFAQKAMADCHAHEPTHHFACELHWDKALRLPSPHNFPQSTGQTCLIQAAGVLLQRWRGIARTNEVLASRGSHRGEIDFPSAADWNSSRSDAAEAMIGEPLR